MNKHMKMWWAAKNHVMTHGNIVGPFMWQWQDCLLEGQSLSCATFTACAEWQQIKFTQGNWADFKQWMVHNRIPS